MKRPTITPAMKLAVISQQMTCAQCQHCGEWKVLSALEYDHIVALVDGGEHAITNMQTLCMPCHAKKSAHEHRENCRAKRLAKAQEAHGAVVARVMERPASKLKGRGFDKTKTRRFDGRVVPRD